MNTKQLEAATKELQDMGHTHEEVVEILSKRVEAQERVEKLSAKAKGERKPKTHKVAREKVSAKSDKPRVQTKKETNMKPVKSTKPEVKRPVWDPANPTIEALSVMLLDRGYGIKDALAKVKAVFPTGDTSKNCMYYYASKYGISQRKGAKADQKQLKALLREIA